jgi:KDO2-lipid IV(A) lauroyltransferase
MDLFINEYREIVGQKVAYNRGKEGILAMGRYLKEKHLLGILFDQDTNDTGVTTTLFGKEVITPAGPAVFSRTFGCPILPIFMHYDEDGRCRAKIYPPLYAEKTKDKERDLARVTEKMMAVLEQEIRENPPMWFWVHDRWKDGKKRFRPKK